jgi:osmotically inducible protein OsmC
LVVDNTNILQDQRGGTAKQLLAASALYCYCVALVGALEARGVKYDDITAKAVLETGSNDVGQGRVRKIAIEARVVLSEDYADIFDRVERILRPGCLVTGSLHDGIQMEYDLQPVYDNHLVVDLRQIPGSLTGASQKKA